MPRTVTKHLKTFTRPFPSAVTYDLSKPNVTTITLPIGSEWTSGLHWHETHDEYLSIRQGRALVTLGNHAREYGVSDGIIEVKKGTLHEWRRIPLTLQMKRGQESSIENKNEEEVLVVQEWTEPRDGKKEVFFRMLNSCLTEGYPQHHFPSPPAIPTPMGVFDLKPLLHDWGLQLQLFIIFRTCDNWPVFMSDHCGWWMNWWVTHIVLWVGWILGGHILGMEGRYDEYVLRGDSKR